MVITEDPTLDTSDEFDPVFSRIAYPILISLLYKKCKQNNQYGHIPDEWLQEVNVELANIPLDQIEGLQETSCGLATIMQLLKFLDI
jgi:hypothetical protein